MDKIVTRSRAAYTMMASNDQNTDDIHKCQSSIISTGSLTNCKKAFHPKFFSRK